MPAGSPVTQIPRAWRSSSSSCATKTSALKHRRPLRPRHDRGRRLAGLQVPTAGDNGVIYAVNTDGQLLRYEDLSAQGTAGHSDAVMIGGSSWDDFKFLTAGDNGVIYAVVP